MKIKKGTRLFGKSPLDGGIGYVFISENMTDMGIQLLFPGIGPINRGQGRFYQDPPIIKKTKRRTLIKNFFGWDV